MNMSRTSHQSLIDLAMVFADESAEPFPDDLMKRVSIAIITDNLLDQLNWLLREELTEDRRGQLARICLGLEDQLDEAKQAPELIKERGKLIQVIGWPVETEQFGYFAKGFSMFESHYTKFSDDQERWTEINWGYNGKYVSKFQSAITELRAFVNVSYAHLNGISFKESLAKMKRFRWEQRAKKHEERQQRVDELFAELLNVVDTACARRVGSSENEGQLGPTGSSEIATAPAVVRKCVNWEEICEATGRSNTPTEQKRIRKLNDNYCGPIKFGTKKGEHPIADRTELLNWWGNLENHYEESHQLEVDKKETLDISHAIGRDGTAYPEINGSERKSRKK